MPRYKFLEHMTDAEIEAYGSNLEEAFENAARAIEDTMVDIQTISKSIKEEIVVEGTDKQSLLYNWIESLIIRQDVDNMLYSDFSCKIFKTDTGFKLTAQISGEKYDKTKHEQKTAIKAPTYHDMRIDETPKLVTLRFLVDL